MGVALQARMDVVSCIVAVALLVPDLCLVPVYLFTLKLACLRDVCLWCFVFWGFFVTYSLGVLFSQVQIPSKTDKPGGSPVRQLAQEVRKRRGSLLLLYVVNVWLISEASFCVFRISCQLRCCCPQSTNWTSSSVCCLQIVLGFYFERACCDITVWCDLWPM